MSIASKAYRLLNNEGPTTTKTLARLLRATDGQIIHELSHDKEDRFHNDAIDIERYKGGAVMSVSYVQGETGTWSIYK